MKILSIVGARPQFIKVGLLSKELRHKHDEKIVHTGQHYDYNLSKTFFDQLGIPEPHFNLEVGSGSHGKQTGEMLSKLEDLYLAENPDLVIVFGDTNSTLGGALAASKLHIPIAHVEAGMRNFDRKKPEEINRIVTDHISDYLFAPTENAKQNLANEGLTKNVYVVGDISNDILQVNKEIAEEKSSILTDLGVGSGAYYLLTIHKSKNTDSKRNLAAIISAMADIRVPCLFPAHPRTRNKLREYGLMEILDRSAIRMIDPLSYFDFIKLLNHSQKIITDSGGVQKEAYVLKIPCITLRETEWVETVKDGWNVIVDIHNPEEMLRTISEFNPTTPQSNFLGNGDTHLKISEVLCNLET